MPDYSHYYKHLLPEVDEHDRQLLENARYLTYETMNDHLAHDPRVQLALSRIAVTMDRYMSHNY